VDGEIIWRLSQIYHEDLWVSLADWSPDGTHLALRLTSGTEDFLAMVGADGDDLQISSPHPIDYGSIQWSPDGTHIAFTSPTINSSNKALNIIRSDGTDHRVLANDLGYGFAWLPDSTGIIDVRLNGEVITVSKDGLSRSTLTTIPIGENYQSISPDGTMIAYTNSGRYGASDLFVKNIDGSNLRQLTHNPGNQMCFHWPF
jgi:Tol biopolymer transport system component